MTTEATPGHLDWPAELDKQLSWHWEHQMRPRLEGLSDAEYFWEPVSGCWSIRPRAEAVALAVGSGLILHINREVIHHGAEIALLRDLYRTGLASREIR